MKVNELMSAPAVTVAPDLSIKAAAALLVEKNITAAPVLDADGRLVGIVSGADLLAREVPADPRLHLRRMADPGPPPRRVSDVMTARWVGIAEGADAADAIAVMVERRVKSLPVLSDDRVVGMVSQRDLLRALARDDKDIHADVLRRLGESVVDAAGYDIQVHEGVVTVRGTAEQQHIAQALVATVPGVLRVVAADTAADDGPAGS